MNSLLLNKRAFLQLGGALLALPGWSQSYPSRVVSLVVPYPAGGGSDFLARQLQPELSRQLGQTVIVENTGGVGGAIGVQKVLSAPPDGYQLVLGSPMELMLTPLAISAVKYKPEDLVPVAQIMTTTMVLLTRKDLPARNIQELVDAGRKKELSYGSVGPGSLYHLVAERFSQLTQLRTLHVPYKGMAPVLTDLMGGQIDMAFVPLNGNVPHLIQEGQVKALGVTARAPNARLPNVEALAARPGFESLEFDIWGGIQVPRRTPADVVARLHAAVYESLRNPDIRKAYEGAGNTVPDPMPLARLEQLYRAEIGRYQAMAKSVNLQTQ
ncbi:tripartite tricarboxylate transporter substrate binding protein [Pseudorhodoferax sp.]|uniref:tripartite tricarboxylate transporter substrate binding protein n=1 Tax=Pseudorhodoferax sp. TaxID=1993553 RepID=UPI002DD674D4|nr:tripartite tricarboxylate transporter substrate binding protein [Pseudorhodoferax sp.]